MSWTIAPIGRGDNLLYSQAGSPSLDLRFASTKSLVDFVSGQNLITFTRVNPVSTYVDGDKLIKLADANIPRFDHDFATGESLGLLVEEARANLALHNRDLANAAWVVSSITAAKDQVGADGVSNSASSIAASAGNGTILQTITSASAARATSAYVKRITGTGTIEMTQNGGSTWTAVTVTSAWTRVTIPSATITNPVVGFRIVTSGDAIAVDYVQCENGAFATSAIPTTTATVTRSADVCSISGSNFSSWFTNANENTFYVEAIKTAANVPFGTFFCGSDSSVNAINGGWIVLNPTGERMRFQSRHSSVRGDTQNNAAVITSGALIKGALCTSTTTFGASYNGSLIASISTPAQLDWGTSLTIGWFPNGGYTSALNGHIRRLAYFDRRLPNATLQAITA
jgi:hypothetical protein